MHSNSTTALDRDPYFQLRLVCVCVGVAIVVSIIYIVVVYKIASDIGSSTELNAISTEATNFQYVLDTHEIEQSKIRIEAVLNKNYAANLSENNATYSFFLFNSPDAFSFTNLPPQTSNKALEKTSVLVNEDNQGIINIDNKTFAWIRLKTKNNADIIFFKSAQSIPLALNYITKRLIVTSIITFWIAVWLALFLATWINKKVQKKNDDLAHIATHDVLTKLPNRLHLFSKCRTEIKELISQNKIDSNKTSGAILQLNLNSFKEVNDAYGHAIGDKVLIKFAQTIQPILSKKEILVRMSGDEFIIWSKGLNEASALKIAERILDTCTNRIVIHDLSIEVIPSIGIALLFQHGTDLDTIMTYADLAMHQAKSNRLGSYVYNETLGATYLYEAKLRSDISEAIKQEQIFLLYQPKVDTQTGKIIGVEALARWEHPIEGIISPIHFIPLIEKSVHIHKFTRYVIEKAIMQAKQWQLQDIDMVIAVNISPYNLLDINFVQDIQTILTRHNLSSSSLEIELTETAMMSNISSTKLSLIELQKIGVSIAIDDFGTGLSSLSYISQLNADVIKIDRSFVMDMNTNKHNFAIVEAIIHLSNRLNWTVVAEGVESQEQLNTLKSLGCPYAQGYYFNRPLPADKISTLMADNIAYPV